MNFLMDNKNNILSSSGNFSKGLSPLDFVVFDISEFNQKNEKNYSLEIKGKKYKVDVKKIKTSEELYHINISSEQKDFYKNIFKESILAIATHRMIFDEKGQPVDYIFTDINEEFKNLTGLNSDVLGKTVLETLPETEKFWIKKYGEIVKTGKSERFQNYSVAFDKWFDVFVFKNQKDFFTTVFRDITEEKKTRDDLAYTKDFLDNIISSMPSMLIGIDKDYKINEWNVKASEITGIPEEKALGKDLRYIIESHIIQNALTSCDKENSVVKMDRVKGLINGRNDLILEVLIYKLDENIKDGYVLILSDISERIHLQEMMIQNEKMISVGGLAAGMAHEINNPISGILQGVQNIKRRLSPDFAKNIAAAERFDIDLIKLNDFLDDRKIDLFLDGIEESGFRAANIISNMLQFSGKSAGERKQIILKELIERVYELASNEFDLSKKVDFKKIQVDMSKVEEDIMLHCVDTEIEQVLLNLVINAAHAVFSHRKDDGRINFITKRKDDKIFIEVEDNGPGIDETLKTRIFEPFFTTKEAGEGTGLGLSVSYFIIKEHHGGDIYVSTGEMEGTRFTIILPGGRKNGK